MPNSVTPASTSLVCISTSAALGVYGWVCSQSYTRQSDGYKVEVYNGPKTSLADFIAAVKAEYPKRYTEIEESLSDGGAATVTVTIGDEDTTSGAGTEETEDVKDPDYQITPTIEEIPIECHDAFASLTAEQIGQVHALVDAADTAGIEALTGAQAKLAYWLTVGVTTYKQPCFQVSVTRYKKLKTTPPGDIYSDCGTVVKSIGGVPANALPAGQWEYLKLCPTVTPEQKWLRCAYEYLGAKRWPATFYPGGSWKPDGGTQ